LGVNIPLLFAGSYNKKIDLEKKSVYELPGNRSYTVDRWITANASCIDFYGIDKLINTRGSYYYNRI
jgi:hypothetical protein